MPQQGRTMTADEFRKTIGRSYPELWESCRRNEVGAIGVCCTWQRQINESIAAQAKIQLEVDNLWGLPPCLYQPCADQREQRVDDLSSEQDAMAKKDRADWAALLLEYGKLARWTAKRQAFEKAMVKEFNKKRKRGEVLGEDEIAMESRFVGGAEYVLHGLHDGLKDRFEVDESMDCGRSVAARWMSSCLSWLCE